MNFADEIAGERVVLVRNKPTIEFAKKMFATIDSNRDHLRPWFPWEKATAKEEDSLKYLFDNEDKFKKGTKVEYGIYVEGEYIGNIGFFDINEKNKCGEIGYWLSSKFIRKGYMTEALRVLEKHIFNSTDVNRIVIKCDEKNKASEGVIRKCGYVLEGKFREDYFCEHTGRFRNTLFFSKIKKDLD